MSVTNYSYVDFACTKPTLFWLDSNISIILTWGVGFKVEYHVSINTGHHRQEVLMCCLLTKHMYQRLDEPWTIGGVAPRVVTWKQTNSWTDTLQYTEPQPVIMQSFISLNAYCHTHHFNNKAKHDSNLGGFTWHCRPTYQEVSRGGDLVGQTSRVDFITGAFRDHSNTGVKAFPSTCLFTHKRSDNQVMQG